MSLISLLLPDFSLILIGLILFRLGRFPAGFWSGLERLVYFVLFPALLFNSTAHARFDLDTTSKALLAAVGATGCAMAAAMLGKLLESGKSRVFASGFQTAFRFNSYIALALAQRLHGPTGLALMALLIALNVPIANFAAVIALSSRSAGRIGMALMTNPLIIATLSGLAVNATSIALFEPLSEVLSRLGSASIALGLLAVGAGLQGNGAAEDKRLLGWFLFVKLAICPASAWALCLLLATSPEQRDIVVLFGALPTASSAYILARNMGGNGAAVAFLVSAGTTLALITLPLWLTAMRVLG